MKPDKNGSFYKNSVSSLQLSQYLHELPSVAEGNLAKILTKTEIKDPYKLYEIKPRRNMIGHGRKTH
jgi:hypothetical protein